MSNSNQESLSSGVSSTLSSPQISWTQPRNTNTANGSATLTITENQSSQNQDEEVLRLTLQPRPSVTWYVTMTLAQRSINFHFSNVEYF